LLGFDEMKSAKLRELHARCVKFQCAAAAGFLTV
jgi:hypothetical protein